MDKKGKVVILGAVSTEINWKEVDWEKDATDSSIKDFQYEGVGADLVFPYWDDVPPKFKKDDKK